MTYDARNSNFLITKSSQEERGFPTISLTKDLGNEPNPTESSEASNYAETSLRFSKIKSQGLNPLKPVIIANTEFIPVSDGMLDSSGLRVQQSNGSLTSVNSVTKLFELHRQIRLATLKTAGVLLSRVKGYDSNEVLKEIRDVIDGTLEDLSKSTLKETVDAVIQKIINFQTDNLESSIFLSNVKNTKSSALKSKKNQKTISKSFNRTSQEELSKTDIRSSLSGLFAEKSQDPYLRTLVEYAILEFLIFDILQYMSGILSLKDAGLKTWSVNESLQFSNSSNIDVNSFSPNTRKLLERSFKGNAGVLGGTDLETIFNILTGVKTSASTSDITLLLQYFVSAADALSITESGYLNSLPEQTIVDYPLINNQSHVKDALTFLSKGYGASLYSNLEIDGVPFKTNKDDVDYGENTFNYKYVENIIDYFPESLTETDVFGDLLAACLFNDCFDIAARTFSSNFLAFGSLNSTNSTPSGINSLKTYYKELISYEGGLRTVDGGVNFVYALSGGKLLSFLSPKPSFSELPNYIPLESTQDSIIKTPYLTGPEYFYDLALQRGDDSFKSFSDFSNTYKNFTNNYASDIYTITKLDYIEFAAKKLLLKIGKELITSARNGESVLLLSLIASQGRSSKGLMRLYKSAYFASRLKKKEDKSGDGLGKSKEASPFQDIGDVTAEQGSRRVMRAVNQNILRELLESALGIESKKIKDERKFSVRNLKNGNKQRRAFKPKEYTEKDKEFSKIPGGKNLNEGTEEKNQNRIIYTIHKQSGKKNGYDRDGLNKEEAALEGGANFSTSLCESIKYFLENKHFEDAGLFNSTQRQNFNKQRESEPIDEGVNKQGENVALYDHQRAFLLYAYLVNILTQSLTVNAESFDPDGSNNSRIELRMNADEIEGIAQAFIDSGSDLNILVTPENSDWNSAKIVAYNNTKEHLTKFNSAISNRIRKISSLLIVPAIHGQLLYQQYLKAKNFVTSGDGSNRSKLAISILKDPKIKAFENALDLLTPEGVSQIYKSYVNTFLRDKFSYTFEDCPDLRQMKLMMKILSQTGYGLLSSEKRGPKTICHVGLTNSMLSSLRYQAYREFKNREFLESKRFCVNIFKRNEIDSLVYVYPKTFLFDSSLHILDQNIRGKKLNHIENFTDTWNLNQIIDNIEFTQWTNNSSAVGDPFYDLKKNFSANFNLGSNLRSDFGDDLLINHILDYALKIYYRFSLGLDFDENTFTLSPIRKRSGVVSGGISTLQSAVQQDYNNLINQVKTLYPAANIDPKLGSELFRAIEIIAANPIYSLVDKTKKIIYPKKFDRVLSIALNEKDFIIYTPAYDKNFEDVYLTHPNFTYTSKISRTDFNRRDKDFKVINKYIDSCKEDFPEVFSLYATITMLPDGVK